MRKSKFRLITNFGLENKKYAIQLLIFKDAFFYFLKVFLFHPLLFFCLYVQYSTVRVRHPGARVFL